MPKTPVKRRLRIASLTALIALVVLGSCSGGGDEKGAASSTSSAKPTISQDTGGTTATPASSPEEALTALLNAERNGDHKTSYRLLSARTRKSLDLSKWSRRRSELPAVVGFRVEGSEGGVVTAVVQHEPGLDPFVGLRAGEERQRWKARREGGGWLLDGEPEVKPLYPSRDDASGAALAWVRALQACDEKAAKALQGVDRLFGTAAGTGALCKSTAVPTAGVAEAMPAGFASQEIVAQYGPEAFEWAATVEISSTDRPFHVVLAPIGSVWKVIGVFEP